MSVFAISDLHLSQVHPKPMEIFGQHWQNYMRKIEECWRDMILPEDTVLIAGDISWAMKIEYAVPDLERIRALPGKKVLLRGNHDYWWGSLTRVRALAGDMTVIQNDAAAVGDIVYCGSRGWLLPGVKDFSKEDRKIFDRELIRLKMSLDSAVRIADGRKIVVLTHFPPLDSQGGSDITRLIEQYPVCAVIYGHIHGGKTGESNPRIYNGIPYYLTSCDMLGFCPIRIDI